MGFPLSTDIFGQLKWLVKQLKLLAYRVTKIEQGGGGGGSQNLNQVLATGNTATAKKLVIEDTALGARYSIVGDATGWGIGFIAEYTSGFGGKSQMAPGYTQHFDSSVSGATLYHSTGINFNNIYDTTGISLRQYDGDTGIGEYGTRLATNRYDGGQYVESGLIFDYIEKSYKIGGYGDGCVTSSIITVNDETGVITASIFGQNKLVIEENYQMLVLGNNRTGFVNNYNGNLSCEIGDTTADSWQGTKLVVSYGADRINTNYNNTEYGLSFDMYNQLFTFGDVGGNWGGVQFFIDDNTRKIYTGDYGAGKGILIDLFNDNYTLGNKMDSGSYFGIDCTNNQLVAEGIRDTGSYVTPSGFIPININGIVYYIELWKE